MAKYRCPFCEGFAHTSGGLPNPNEFLVWTAKQWDEVPDQVPSDRLLAEATLMYKCVACAALAIFWRGGRSDPTWYSPLRQVGPSGSGNDSDRAAAPLTR